MKTFSIKTSLKRGWELFTKHWTTLLLLGAIFVILGAVQGAFEKDLSGWEPVSLVIFVATILVQILVQIGSTKLLLHMEDGQPAHLGEIFAHKEIFWRYIIASLAYTIMAIVGLVLLVVPGLYVISRFGFVLTAMVDKNLGVEAAFDESSRITEGVRLKVLGFLVVMLLINVVGAIPFGLGLILTIPVTALAWMHVYRSLSSRAVEPQTTA